MKKSWRKHITLACLFASIILGSGLAEAKRMGGGRSMGKQSSNVTQQHRQAQPPQQAPAANPSAAKPKTNWGGILGGAAAGLGLGMLLSHFGGAGMMSGLSNVLMIAALAMLGVWLFRKFRGQNKMQTAQPGYAGSAAPSSFTNTFTPSSAAPYARSDFSQKPHVETTLSPAFATPTITSQDTLQQNNFSIPQGLDTENFLRQAKVYFVRLQAAWDAANTEDIREFTSPEMFAEIYSDLATRGSTINKTEVITLEAQLLGIEPKANHHMASVRFSGSLRETAHAEPESFIEVWNLTKPVTGTAGWVLAGIQQL